MDSKDREIEKLRKEIYRLRFPINDWITIVFRILGVMVMYYFKKSLLWCIVGFMFPLITFLYYLITGGFKDGGFMEIINFYF